MHTTDSPMAKPVKFWRTMATSNGVLWTSPYREEDVHLGSFCSIAKGRLLRALRREHSASFVAMAFCNALCGARTRREKPLTFRPSVPPTMSSSHSLRVSKTGIGNSSN